MTETRKLAAILAADVVGFSRLTGADEDRTLARLRALRSDLIDPTIDVHHGRVVKRMGDGFLVEFRSVVDAVRCAIELQNSMVERNAGLPPERRIVFRIGVHLGDVVEETDGDLMGDGVNIAARLEGIARPARSVFPRTPIARCARVSIWRSAISARLSSRTSSSRSGSIRSKSALPRGRIPRRRPKPPRRKRRRRTPPARPRSPFWRSTTSAATPNRSISPTGSAKTSSPICRRCRICTWSRAIRRSSTKKSRFRWLTSPRRSTFATCSKAACARPATGCG